MSMIHLDLNPSPQKIRQFGMISPFMLAAIGLLLQWRFDLPLIWPAALGGTGIILFLLSRISPILIRPVYQGLVLVGFPIGWVISHMIMILFFFVILTPMALIFRLVRRDVLRRKPDPACRSYWTDHARHESIERFFRQF